MESTPSQRRLAAILCADVAGYSRLMADDHEATLATLTAYREIFARNIAQHQGRIVNAPGDAVLAEFSSVVDAVACSAEIQRELAEKNAELPGHRKMDFRIGVNLDDVLVKDNDLFGDGVNIAARLQALAEPGGIMISGTAFDQVEGRLPLEFGNMGEQQVKNIPKPVRTYRVFSKPGAAAHRVVRARRIFRRMWRNAALAAVAVVVVAGAGAFAWRTWGPAATSVSPSNEGIPTIAVLPFQNLSGDPAQEYFADGISEELITLLAQFRDLSVVARNTVFTYKGKAVDVRQVGNEVGADFVLEGSVRKSAETIRITAQLISAADGNHLWAETFDRKMKAADLFALQDEIAERVIFAVAGQLGAISLQRIREVRRVPPENFSSYECVLRAKESDRFVNAEAHRVARDCLENVVKREPRYAEAWAHLSALYVTEYTIGLNAKPDPLVRAGEAIRRAVALEPSDPYVMAQEAWYLFHAKDPRFISHARKAIESNPRDAYAIGYLGYVIAYTGRWEEGLSHLEKAMKLSPVYPRWFHYPFFIKATLDKDYESALLHVKKYDSPGVFWYHVAMAISLANLGQKEEAHQEVEKLRHVYPGFEEHAYRETRQWLRVDEEVEFFIQAYRKAGMNIPPETPAQ